MYRTNLKKKKRNKRNEANNHTSSTHPRRFDHEIEAFNTQNLIKETLRGGSITSFQIRIKVSHQKISKKGG